MLKIKRKVIQIAGSTCLVSLPKDWIKKHNIKKGAELDVKEQGNKVVVSTESEPELEVQVLDVTGMDRTSILYYLRSAYRRGYDTIEIVYNEPYTTHIRKGLKMKVSSVIHEEISRLVGVEIIQQKESSCTVKSISDVSAKDFNNILRRVFILLDDVFGDIVEGIRTGNTGLLETVMEKHDNITKFLSYCFRLLNKKGYDVQTDITSLYVIVANLEEVIDILKWTARDALKMKRAKFSDKGQKILEKVKESFYQYYDMFYKFDTKKVVNMYENRHEALTELRASITRIPSNEMMILANTTQILNLLVAMSQVRMGIKPVT